MSAVVCFASRSGAESSKGLMEGQTSITKERVPNPPVCVPANGSMATPLESTNAVQARLWLFMLLCLSVSDRLRRRCGCSSPSTRSWSVAAASFRRSRFCPARDRGCGCARIQAPLQSAARRNIARAFMRTAMSARVPHPSKNTLKRIMAIAITRKGHVGTKIGYGGKRAVGLIEDLRLCERRSDAEFCMVPAAEA
eukprot:6201660-Pleurochrysis_carterae.AAC.3